MGKYDCIKQVALYVWLDFGQSGEIIIFPWHVALNVLLDPGHSDDATEERDHSALHPPISMLCFVKKNPAINMITISIATSGQNIIESIRGFGMI